MRAPSNILVVRHGARLDAADANWHLTSPAPYDPPLTYGGWNQAKALGSRIAQILSSKTAQNNAKLNFANGAQNGSQKKPTKKQKVVIHTSPFLRCLQTSVAISAGMAQSLELPEKRGRGKRARFEEEGYDSAPEARGDHSVKSLGLATPDKVNIKTILRVDAFLGEWLSPDYFEKIMSPPSSTMMVAGAKATLLRKDPIEVFQTSTPKPGYFPGGWSKPKPPTIAVEEDDMTVDTMSLMVPLKQQRSSSAHSSGEKASAIKPILSELRPSKAAYNPPVPAYAIAPSQPIPRGYCGHARDACIDLDLLWDSMRFPQDWGDGGELGEEWSAMHKRFRKGLAKMIDWYTRHTPEFHPDREDPLGFDHEDSEDEDDDDYDLTVILVTHAAGCNALVGALTDQPVLHDFGLTSLSMAVRKDQDVGKSHSPVNGHSRSPASRRGSLLYSGISDHYEMQIMSSTNHLRAGRQATQLSALASPHLVPKIPTYASLPHMQNGNSAPEPKRAMSSALGSIRRPSLTPNQSLYLDTSSVDTSRSPSMSGGLWSRTSTISTADEVPTISIGPAFNSREGSPISPVRSPYPGSPTHSEKGAKMEEDDVPPLPGALPQRTASQKGGLWSAGSPKRVPRAKRRWTITERDDMDQ